MGKILSIAFKLNFTQNTLGCYGLKNEMTNHTLPHLKCIRFVSVRSILPSINIGVRKELTLFLRINQTKTTSMKRFHREFSIHLVI